MLTIHKISQEEAAAYLHSKNMDRAIGQEQFMGLSSGEELLGVGSISLIGTKVYLDCVHVTDHIDELEYGLAKALLNMADLRGIKIVYGKNPDLDKLYRKLRFQKEEDEFTLSLEHYFAAEGHE